MLRSACLTTTFHPATLRGVAWQRWRRQARTGAGSASSPIRRLQASPWGCAGVCDVIATPQNSVHTRQSTNCAAVIVPTQQPIPMLYGEPNRHTQIGNNVSQIAVETAIRNRLCVPQYFGGAGTYQRRRGSSNSIMGSLPISNTGCFVHALVIGLTSARLGYSGRPATDGS